MNIFGIIALSFLILGLLYVFINIPCFVDEYFGAYFITNSIIVAILWIASIFIGIGINTEEEKVYVQKYLAQKQTIEMSLENEELSGLEKIELVNQATELNGELAERKARFELWHFVVYDNTIYDEVELIDLTGGAK